MPNKIETIEGKRKHFYLVDRQYVLKVADNGIYLYQKKDDDDNLADRLAQLKSDDSLEIKLTEPELQKFTLFASSYELIFAIVDAIVNRGLQRNFSFEEDLYANNLRIIFSLLVPALNLDEGFAYDREHFEGVSKKTLKLNISAFMAIKRLLDSKFSNKRSRQKEEFVNASRDELIRFDEALQQALEGYHSDDDSESDYSTSDDDTESSIPETFSSSQKNYPKEKQRQINKDMQRFNTFISSRSPEQECLTISEDGKITVNGEQILSDFVIPGFRGINHMPLRFSDEARRLYRSAIFQQRRGILPYFSESVLMSRFDFYRDTKGIEEHFLTEVADNLNLSTLLKNAKQLQEQLLKLRNEDYLLVTGSSNAATDDIRLFSNALFFMQHLYTNGIIKSQRFLKEHLKQGGLLATMANAYNPFVSESEAPEHAYRYSFGRKSLYELAALRPHYNQKGKPSFPYIGEIYLSLRDLGVIVSKEERHQLRRLEAMYRVNPTSYIAPEIESTGMSFLPAGEVAFSQVVKCPSFAGRWKKFHLAKFGLVKTRYYEFKRRFENARTQKQRLQTEEELLDKHLIPHYCDCLLKKALNHAKQHNKILIFLDVNGQLTFTLPQRIPADLKAESETIRKKLEKALREKVDINSPDIQCKLTSKTMKVYIIAPATFREVFNKLLKNAKPEERQKYQQFLVDDERLRTPLNQISVPRNSPDRMAARISSSPYEYSGSSGTPLGKVCYSLSGHERQVMRKSIADDFGSPYASPESPQLFPPRDEDLDSAAPAALPARQKGSQQSGVSQYYIEEDDLEFERAKEESLRSAQEKGEIGSKYIPGWELQDVKDDGNCFYKAVVHQMELMHHNFLATVPKKTEPRDSLLLHIQGRNFKDGEWADQTEIERLELEISKLSLTHDNFLATVPEGTEPRDSLRLRVQGKNFKDGEWADQTEIEKLAREFNFIVAIVDTRGSKHEFIYHYIDTEHNYQHSLKSPNLPGRQIVKLAFTGNHYLSVKSTPKEKELFRVISNGNVELAVAIIRTGIVDLNYIDSKGDGDPLLCHALNLNEIRIARELINAGADVNLGNAGSLRQKYTVKTPLNLAIIAEIHKDQYPECIRGIPKLGIKGIPEEEISAIDGLVQFLLEKGADPNKMTEDSPLGQLLFWTKGVTSDKFQELFALLVNFGATYASIQGTPNYEEKFKLAYTLANEKGLLAPPKGKGARPKQGGGAAAAAAAPFTTAYDNKNLQRRDPPSFHKTTKLILNKLREGNYIEVKEMFLEYKTANSYSEDFFKKVMNYILKWAVINCAITGPLSFLVKQKEWDLNKVFDRDILKFFIMLLAGTERFGNYDRDYRNIVIEKFYLLLSINKEFVVSFMRSSDKEIQKHITNKIKEDFKQALRRQEDSSPLSTATKVKNK